MKDFQLTDESLINVNLEGLFTDRSKVKKYDP